MLSYDGKTSETDLRMYGGSSAQNIWRTATKVSFLETELHPKFEFRQRMIPYPAVDELISDECAYE